MKTRILVTFKDDRLPRGFEDDQAAGIDVTLTYSGAWIDILTRKEGAAYRRILYPSCDVLHVEETTTE